MAKLAIVIPYFKINFFEQTLKSLEAQTSKDFSVYIGNDASPHDPEKHIGAILKNTFYEYISFGNNLGGELLSKQWDRILGQVKDEEWFMILGDDDVLAPNFVEIFYQNLQEIEAAKLNVVKFKQRWIDEAGIPTTGFTDYPKLIDPFERHLQRSSLSEHIFRKSSYKKYGFKEFPLAWKTDNMAVIDFSEGKPLFFIDETFVEIRVSPESISGQTDNSTEKCKAKIQYEKHLINFYYRNLEKSYLRELIANQIYYKYRYNLDLQVNLLKMYIFLGDYKKIIMLPKLLFQLYFKKPQT